jgi:hypothetical protein
MKDEDEGRYFFTSGCAAETSFVLILPPSSFILLKGGRLRKGGVSLRAKAHSYRARVASLKFDAAYKARTCVR